jgi:glycosyltransferase involved in cell wall biosynthesis
MEEWVLRRAADRDYSVSALVSTYNSERFMRGRLEDLEQQTIVPKCEIVIVNSNSRQNEHDIIMDFISRYDNITYMRTPEREPGTVAINRAAKIARGRYLAFSNTDDRYRRDAFEIMEKVFDSHPNEGAAYFDSAITSVENETFESNSARSTFRWPDYSLRQLLRSDIFGPQFFWRKSLHDIVGYFDESLYSASDYDFVIRASWKSNALHVRETLGLYLQSPKSQEHLHQGNTIKETFGVLRKHRRMIPLEDIYPGLKETKDFVVRAAALLDMGNCTILSDTPDPELALTFFQEAKAIAASDPAISSAITVANKLINKQPLSRADRLPIVNHPVVKDARCGRGVSVSNEGTLSDVSQDVDYPNPSFYIVRYVQPGPMVSVILPTFNRPQFLEKALESILNQTYKNFEIIVINDGGSDVENVVAKLNTRGNIVYVRLAKNIERSAARNAGIKIARGKYIAYLDDDDLFYPDHLETLVTTLQSGPHAVAYTDAYRAVQQMADGTYRTVQRQLLYSYDFTPDAILVENQFPNLCCMHRKSCFDEVGLFDESLQTHEDWDLWIRLSRKYSFVHIKKATAEYSYRDDRTNTSTQRLEDFYRTRQLLYKKFEAYAHENPNVLMAQQNALESHRRMIFPGANVAEMMQTVLNLVEQGLIAQALTFYDANRAQCPPLPELIKFDSLINRMRTMAQKTTQ